MGTGARGVAFLPWWMSLSGRGLGGGYSLRDGMGWDGGLFSAAAETRTSTWFVGVGSFGFGKEGLGRRGWVSGGGCVLGLGWGGRWERASAA